MALVVIMTLNHQGQRTGNVIIEDLEFGPSASYVST